ncbi:MAG: biotin synthase BioB [Synechococcus sp. BS301-5m-G54]|jgi:biotin synthase|uniref:biotin synthase BioB n=1 Tax=Synechococcus sp. KORDI-49 TaxID=585423 RepID=UPI0004E0A094|nr:biotin synthase BioB [Synechococcus sp. KORDI-49]AII45539.1 biotin synthase [Synechococcus sp. KORDI-49]MBL6738774.1 biotin synthase BioB [Synechococcus sp. BS301-5m-G54]MBL6795510.1 biotin synthase BioB [Synechococcus sp. BS307-5m-G34]
MTLTLRHDWTTEEILALLRQPLMELLWQAQAVHREANPGYKVQLASLLSVKTGGCEEDCAYCSQSIHNSSDVTGFDAQMQVEPVLQRARAAKQAGADRFCMGWAWREIRDGTPFEAMLEMVRGVRELGLEACVTAGMLTDRQAERLADAGLTAYNHNLDTSPEHYDRIISTRTYQERLETLQRVRKAGVTLCCGGIIGMGESLRDRASMLQVLAGMDPHPESVPVNGLVAVEGTPLQDQAPFEPLDLVRMVATARILMPRARVRLSAGRESMSREAQILCLQAGADSIFYGDTLLTTGNPDVEADRQLLRDAGVQANWQENAESPVSCAP